MLDSIDVAQITGKAERTIRRLAKKADESDLKFLSIEDQTFSFTKTAGIGGRGWVYSYTPIQQAPKRPKKKVKLNSVIDPKDLPVILDLSKPTTDEKIALVSFYNGSGHPLSVIAKALIMQHGASSTPQALSTRIKRWTKAYAKDGRRALEDKRGGKERKADLKLIKTAVLGYANHHFTTMYDFYCFVYARTHNIAIDIRNPSADISESAFNRAVKHLLETNQLIKEYTQIGKDAFRYAEPSLGREWLYPNQQWEIDATPLDIFAKVPYIDNKSNFTIKQATNQYQLKRLQLIRIVDNFSGASVFGLFQSANSYADVRLLQKALATLGKPEIIKGDGGSDYMSKHFQAVLHDMGITYIKSRTGRGDDKGKIERGFRSIQHAKEFQSLPGFVGHNVAMRQRLEDQESTVIERRTGAQTNIEADYKWWWEIENWLDNFINTKEADKRELHSPLTKDQLARTYQLLGKRAFKKVSAQGIRHNNVTYINGEMWQHVAIGERVEIIENIDDVSQIFLFQNGQFVCVVDDLITSRKGMSAEDWRKVKGAYRKAVVTPERHVYNEARKLKTEHQEAMFKEFSSVDAQETSEVIEQDQPIDSNVFDAKAEHLAFMKRMAG